MLNVPVIYPVRLDRPFQTVQNGEILLYHQDKIDYDLLPGNLRCWSKKGGQRQVPDANQNAIAWCGQLFSGQTVHRIEEHKNRAGFLLSPITSSSRAAKRPTRVLPTGNVFTLAKPDRTSLEASAPQGHS